MNDTKEEGEITDEDEALEVVDLCAAASPSELIDLCKSGSEDDDTDYRDLLLESYETDALVRGKNPHQRHISSGYSITDENAKHNEKHVRAMKVESVQPKLYQFQSSSLAQMVLKDVIADDDLYELELRRDALASVPVDADVGHVLQWKMKQESSDISKAATKATKSASSRRQEFCEFMQLAHPWEEDILKVLPALEPKCKEIPNCDLVSSTERISGVQDNYEEVEMDIDDTSSSIGNLSDEDAKSVHVLDANIVQTTQPSVVTTNNESGRDLNALNYYSNIKPLRLLPNAGGHIPPPHLFAAEDYDGRNNENPQRDENPRGTEIEQIVLDRYDFNGDLNQARYGIIDSNNDLDHACYGIIDSNNDLDHARYGIIDSNNDLDHACYGIIDSNNDLDHACYGIIDSNNDLDHARYGIIDSNNDLDHGRHDFIDCASDSDHARNGIIDKNSDLDHARYGIEGANSDFVHAHYGITDNSDLDHARHDNIDCAGDSDHARFGITDVNSDLDHVSSSRYRNEAVDSDSMTVNLGCTSNDLNLYVGESCEADSSDDKEDKVEEMEALLLRDQLLRSLTSKHQKPIAEPKNVKIPKHKRVVISLNEESSDSGGEIESSSVDVYNSASRALDNAVSFEKSADLLGNLDSFLHAARQASESMPPISGPRSGRQTRRASTVKAPRSRQAKLTSGSPSEPLISSVGGMKQTKFTSGLPTEPPTTSVGGNKSMNSSRVIVQEHDYKVAASEVVEVKLEALKHKKAKLIYQMKLDELQKKLELQISVERKQAELNDNNISNLRNKIKQKKAQLQGTALRIKKLQELLIVAETVHSSNVKDLSALNVKNRVAHKSLSACRKRIRTLDEQLLFVKQQLEQNQQPTDFTFLDVGFTTAARVEELTSDLFPSQATGTRQSKLVSESGKDIVMMSGRHNKPDGSIRSNLLSKRLVRDSRTGFNSPPDAVNCLGSVNSVDVSSKVQTASQVHSVGSTDSMECTISDKAASQVPSVGSTDSGQCTIKIPSDKKIMQLTQHYRKNLSKYSSAPWAPSCQSFLESDPVLAFQFPIEKVCPDIVTTDKYHFVSAGFVSCLKPYKSSLLLFKAYRFSPYYRLKDNLCVTSLSYSNKLHSQIPLCQFELMGKCLDDKCPWQHLSDYKMNDNELLMDIVSYYPQIANVSSCTPVDEYTRIFDDYVRNFVKRHGASMSSSDLSLLLISQVCAAAGHALPNMIFTDARLWKLSDSKKSCYDVSGSDAASRSAFSSSHNQDNDDAKLITDEDNVVSDEMRYWAHSANNGESNDLGLSNIDISSNVELWLQVVSKRLKAVKRNAANQKDILDHSLNTMARAVEANRSNSVLWQHYLTVYAKRPDAHKDLLLLYEQAIEHAPSYELYWKLLQLTLNCSAKVEVCKQMRQFLCSPNCSSDVTLRSHRLVEVILYQSSLHVTSGHIKSGLQVLQAVVKSKISVIWLTLTDTDKVLMWLTFVHLYEFRKFPACLYDPSDSNPGIIVKKKPFVLPWQTNSRTRLSYETLSELLDEALSMCHSPNNVDPCFISWLCALHRSRILLELTYDRWDTAEEQCREILRDHAQFTDLWILSVQLLVYRCDINSYDRVFPAVAKVLEEALSRNPHSVHIFLAAISVYILLGDFDRALDYAERCPIALFNVNVSDESVDPNFLYCKLLNQTLPVTYQSPALHPDISQQFIDDMQADLWLGYCLLLDLQGAHSQAVETYHIAISRLYTPSDICRLWSVLLRRNLNVLSGRLPWIALDSSHVSSAKRPNELLNLVNLAICSLPVRCHVPFSGESNDYWNDYSSHNEIISMYVSCLPDTYVRMAYQNLLQTMSLNVELVWRASDNFVARDDYISSIGYSLMALQNCPKCLSLWKIYLLHSQRINSIVETRASFMHATKCLPYAATLWKDFIIFELTCKNTEQIQFILTKCKELGVSVGEDFISKVLH